MLDLKRFPFTIKNRHVIVLAPGYKNALGRILMKHPNKFVKTKHAKNMDLINAQKQAKEESKTKKGQLIYVILEDDEFTVKDFMTVKETDDTYSIWRDGAKIDSPNGTKNNSETETKQTMETKEKSPAKKVAAKKVAKTRKLKKPGDEQRRGAKVAAKKVKAAGKEKVEKKKVGASFFFTPDQWKKVEGHLKKEDLAFNAWANQLVFKQVG